MGTPRSFQWVTFGDGMDTEPVLALEPLSAIVGVRQQIHLLLLNPFLVPLYGRELYPMIEFGFLGGSHDTHTCDVGHRRSEGDVA